MALAKERPGCLKFAPPVGNATVHRRLRSLLDRGIAHQMSMTGRRMTCRRASLIAATVALSAACAPAAWGTDPLSPAAAREAFYDHACSKLVSTFATNSEGAHRAEIPGWIRICSDHPRPGECVATAYLIRGQSKAAPMKCGQDVKVSADIAASFLPSFDRVCANVAVAWLSNTETQLRTEVAGWTKTCNAHPDVSVCKGAGALIDENRKVQPLNCGSNGS